MQALSPNALPARCFPVSYPSSSSCCPCCCSPTPCPYLQGGGKASAYDAALVARIYREHLNPSRPQPHVRRQAALGSDGDDATVAVSHAGRPFTNAAGSGGQAASGAGVGRVPDIQILEYSSYLEYYLWPHFQADVPFEHVASIVLLVNEKAREGMPLWDGFAAAATTSEGRQARAKETCDGSAPVSSGADRSGGTASVAGAASTARAGTAVGAESASDRKFAVFFTRVVLLRAERALESRERTAHISFLINAFASLENERLRKVRPTCGRATPAVEHELVPSHGPRKHHHRPHAHRFILPSSLARSCALHTPH